MKKTEIKAIDTEVITDVICNNCGELMAYRELLRLTLGWRGMDGDGITDPLRAQIRATLDYYAAQECTRPLPRVRRTGRPRRPGSCLKKMNEF